MNNRLKVFENDEVNLNRNEEVDFDTNIPRIWSVESLDFIKSVLKVNEFSYHEFVVLFCVADNEPDANEVDYEFIYHKISSNVLKSPNTHMVQSV